MYLVLIILFVLMVAGVPSWPHSRNWGYGPSGALGFALVVVLVLFLLGRL